MRGRAAAQLDKRRRGVPTALGGEVIYASPCTFSMEDR
jgi:hypothetical protein